MAGNAREAGRTTASRLLAVLDAFAESRRSLTMSQISRVSGVPLATTHRIVGELRAWGALDRSDDGSYEVGTRLWQLGTVASPERELHDAALAAMQDLYEATGHNVQLSVRDGDGVLHLAKVSGRRCVEASTDVGVRMPLHATATGKIFLAFSERRLLVDTVRAGLRRYTQRTITEPGRLAASVARAKVSHVAHAREERRVGFSAVAAPILGDDGQLSGAVALVGRSSKNLDAHEARVIDAGNAVSSALSAKRRMRSQAASADLSARVQRASWL